MKILVLGTSQGNFIYQLCKSIRENDPSFEFFALDSLRLNKGDALAEHITLIPQRVTPLRFAEACLRSLGEKTCWDTLSYILLLERKPGKALHFLYQWNKELALFLANDRFRDMDAVHFHFIQYSYVRPIHFVPRDKKVVCTFWGSDLMRTGDSFNHFFVGRALERADAITIQSTQLREMLLAKFGRNLKRKIEILKLSAEKTLYDRLDALTPESTDTTARALGIRRDRTPIVVGHNASPFNNQVLIAKALGSLKDKQRVQLIFPLMYGATPEERASIKAQLEETLVADGFDYLFLEEFLSWDQLAVLRKLGDIMIHLPDSDALSAAITEAMYAGNAVVTGSWLPYGPFAEAGLRYWTLNDLSELPERVESLLVNLAAAKQECAGNRQRVREHFFPEVTSRGWIRMFSEVVQHAG
jgi:glycosyltransferase involved in cell wall biosynthesis